MALVAQSVARTLSDLELAQIHLGQEVVELPPTHVSQEAVENGLYAVTFTLPEEKNSLVSDGQVLSVDLPIGMADTSETIPFIPLDAVYQNSDQAYVFVTQENRAQTRPIVLGSVFGSFVEVKEGLQKADQVILDRNVIDGDPILTINQQAANQSEK